MRRLFPVLLVVSILSACGGSDSGGSHPKAKTAKSPEEALSWLGGADKTHYETWRDSLVKGCDARVIFGNESRDVGSVDLDLLAKRLGGRMLVKGDGGEFAFLGAPEGLPGVQHGSHESKTSVDGKDVEGLSATSELSGTHCTVSLYGQKVFDGQVARRVSVLGHYNPRKRRPKTRIAEGAEEVARDGKGAVATTAFTLPVGEALMGNDATYPFIESALGLRAGDGKVLFKLGAPYDDGTIIPTSWKGAPFSSRHPEILGDETEVGRFRANGHHEETMKWLLRAIESGSTPAPAEAWTVTAKIAFDGTAAKGGTSQLVGLTLEAPTPYADEVATTCFANRFVLEKLFYSDPSTLMIRPTFEAIAGPCDALSADVTRAILADGNARRLFMSMFNTVTPTKTTVYGDWRDALLVMATIAADSGKDLATTLDPEGIVATVRAGAADAQYFIDGAKELPELRGDLIRFSFNLALAGTRPEDRAGILEAAKRAGPSFLDSTRALLASLGTDPKADPEALRFARDIAPVYVDAWRDTESKATAPGALKWVRSRRAETLQKRWSVDTLKGWNTTLVAAKVFADQDLGRVKSTFHSTHDNATENLVARALDEGWDAATFAEMTAITAAGKMRAGCGFSDSAAELANCIGLERFTRKKGGFLSPTYGGRYASFAPKATEIDARLSEAQSSTRYSFESTVFAPIWERCDNITFANRVDSLTGKVGELLKAELTTKWKIESEIYELLKDCRGNDLAYN